jgi:hypothetical protein
MNGVNEENDIEGKAVRETATERGREGVSFMNDEMKTKLAPGSRAHLILVRSRSIPRTLAKK